MKKEVTIIERVQQLLAEAELRVRKNEGNANAIAQELMRRGAVEMKDTAYLKEQLGQLASLIAADRVERALLLQVGSQVLPTGKYDVLVDDNGTTNGPQAQ